MLNVAINGVSQPGFCPESSLSAKILEKVGFAIPARDRISVVNIPKASAAFVPDSLSRANSAMLFLFPEGINASVGLNKRQIPVKASSSRSIETIILPLAGSLMTALFPLNPQSTTK